MDTVEKLKILSADSQYDLACACGTTKYGHRTRGLDGKWLYPVALPGGGQTILLKTLLSNACSGGCKYCPLRVKTDIRRCTLTPDEVARVFMQYYERRMAFGLFLSSGIMGSADATMDRINAAARMLRYNYGFKGYIHLKVIPGASDAAIEDSLSLATAVSLNIETPGKKHSDKISAGKDYFTDIIRPIRLMGGLTARGGRYQRVKCTTQFIVGASDETDYEIVGSMYSLYGEMNFKRVYFSAYQRGLGEPDIPGEMKPASHSRKNDALVREHRLYQADFLCRKYGFKKGDILFGPDGSLSMDKDPKEVWADNHPEFFPVRLNTATKEALLKVPGLGPDTAQKIIEARGFGKIRRIEELGVKGKRLARIKAYAVPE
ncbi:MAG: helix-hairpin-helix domain-containing protein [Actinomycetota bacterium]|nr:helix-hairpin-helix domain-containing protein [Actinomycetota bacterium]